MSAEKGGHLQRTLLTGTKIKGILSHFGCWLTEADFKVADRSKSDRLMTCNDPGLYKATQSLLNELDLDQKVTSSIRLLKLLLNSCRFNHHA